MKTYNLRSDTVTRPTPEVRAAMAAAIVGDGKFFTDHLLTPKVEYLFFFPYLTLLYFLYLLLFTLHLNPRRFAWSSLSLSLKNDTS